MWMSILWKYKYLELTTCMSYQLNGSKYSKRMMNITVFKLHKKIHLQPLQKKKKIQDKMEGLMEKIVSNYSVWLCFSKL